MGLLIISSAIFGLTQAITSSRSHNIFLFYMLSPATFKQITLALIASRLIVVILYAFIFIVLSFYALNIITILNFKALILRLIVVILYAFIFIVLSFYALNIITILNFKALILGFVSVFSSVLFCFCLAIFVARIFQNEQSILGFCNIINLYALMSCNVFVPLEYLPNIGQLFIKTSIFYYLNQLLIKAFQGIDTILVLATSTFFIIGGIILFLLSANRMLLTPKERMR